MGRGANFGSGSVAAFVGAAGNYNVFIDTGVGINHYERGPNTTWGG